MTDYRKLDALNYSTIKTLLQKSAMHARMEQATSSEPTPAMERGTALHAMILEGRDITVVIDAPDFRTKAAQEARDQARGEGLVPILRDKVPEFLTIASAVKEQIERAGFSLSDGRAEHPLMWNDGAVPCKARPDWVKNDASLILDLKITELSSPAAFQRSVASSGYDLQSYWYTRAVRMALEAEARFVFCVVEAEPPYPVYFLELSPAWQEIARVKCDRALQLWGACIESGTFPGYPDGVQRIEPPAWELAGAEEIDAQIHSFSKEAFLFGRCAPK